MKRRIIALLLVLLLLVTAMPLGALAAQTSEETQSTKIEAESPAMLQSSEINYVYFDTIEEAGIYLREGLINRSLTRVSENTLEVHIAYRKSKTSEDDADLMSIVYEHTGNPKGGDFLEKNIFLVESSNSEDDTYNYFSGWFVFLYTHAQDEELDAAVAQLLAELDLDGKSEYEKVRAIYDWMCMNIEYDYTYTYYDPYSALCRRTSICQGYGTLFYRLCLEAGVDSRYCGGYARTLWGTVESHGWNLARVDGQYYYVDTTWGAGMIEGEPDYYYLLKGINGMADHLIVPSRWEYEIGDYCTVAEEDYPIPEKSIILSSGPCAENATYTVTKAGQLTISGTGKVEHAWQGYGQGWEQYSGYIKEVVVEEGITELGETMFYFYDFIASVSLPNSLVSVGKDAFFNCQLTTLEIPANLKTIGLNAFANSLLQTITVDPANPYYCAVNGSLFSKDKKTLVLYAGIIDPEDSSIIRTYTVPEGVETIGAGAFHLKKELKEVILPDSVKYIEAYAFSGCGYIDGEAMGLKLPDSIVSIGERAFQDCKILTSLHVGKNLRHIDQTAFIGMHAFDAISVHAENGYFTCKEGVLFSKDMTELLHYSLATPENYEIPYGVKEIWQSAFYTSTPTLTSVTFPDTLLKIGAEAFVGQEALRELKLPNSLEIIENQAFAIGVDEPYPIDTLIIPDSVKRIEFTAFGNNRATTIIIGSGVEYLGSSAFIRGGYIEGGENPEVKVYFRGAPPSVEDNGAILLFGYNVCGFPEGKVTVYYPAELSHLWAPNGETFWYPNPNIPVFGYNIEPYTHVHIYETETSPANCVQNGSTTYTCSGCGDVYTEIIPATGHSWNPTTCTSAKTCKTCGLKQDKTDHSYDHEFDYKCNACGNERIVDMTRPMVDMFRMYDPNSGEHFYTGSMEERENLVAVGWQYEGVGFTFPLTTGKPVHRLYDPVTGEHLYTMDEDEMNMLLAQGWNYEGIAFNSGFENEVPQYRLHNPNATRGAYHFTASIEERDFLISVGWEYQGIGWYSLGAN